MGVKTKWLLGIELKWYKWVKAIWRMGVKIGGFSADIKNESYELSILQTRFQRVAQR